MDKRFTDLVRNQFHAAAYNPVDRPALISLMRTDINVMAFAREECERMSNPMLRERDHVSRMTYDMLLRAIEEASVVSQHTVTIEEAP